MPRYFFDFHDDVDLIDHDGQELPDLGAARSEAARALSEAAKDILPFDGPARAFVIQVRDEAGSVVLTARLAYSAEPSF